MAGPRDQRSKESIRTAGVGNAGGQHHQRPIPDHVLGDAPAREVQIIGSARLCDRHWVVHNFSIRLR